MRWAISSFIDRQQIVDVGYLGAALVSPLPLPEYPALKPYIDGVKDLLAKYNTLEYDPKKGEALLTKKGWKKDGQGFWVDAQGNRLKLDIIGFGSSGPAIGPVLVELLKRQGVDASMSLPPDFDDRFQKGQYTGAIYGHGGGVNDPYYTLRLYQSSTVAVPGAHLVNFARWKNEAYDKIVDDVFVTDMRNKTAPDGALPQGDGDLAPRPAGHPAGPQHPPDPDEHDVLAELADGGDALRQRRLLAPHLRDGALESPADAVATARQPPPGGRPAGRGRAP